MGKILILFFLNLYSEFLYAKTIKIAVLDTGYTKGSLATEPPICRTFNATSDESINDLSEFKHGTNIIGLIDNTIRKNTKLNDYCFYIIKVFNPPFNDGISDFSKGLKELIRLGGVDIINISGGGADGVQVELEMLTKLMNSGTIVVTAAGNKGNDLDKVCDFFPACYKSDGKLISVGNGKNYNQRYPTSNFGKINVHQWIDGVNKCVIMKRKESICLTGTSQSAAIYSGLVATGLLQLNNSCLTKGKCE